MSYLMIGKEREGEDTVRFFRGEGERGEERGEKGEGRGGREKGAGGREQG